MALCKILAGLPQDVMSLFSGKNGLKYSGVAMDAMRALAQTAKDKVNVLYFPYLSS